MGYFAVWKGCCGKIVLVSLIGTLPGPSSKQTRDVSPNLQISIIEGASTSTEVVEIHLWLTHIHVVLVFYLICSEERFWAEIYFLKKEEERNVCARARACVAGVSVVHVVCKSVA